MMNKVLYMIWAGLYALCAVLGIIPTPTWLGIAACIAFFIPPGVLLWRRGAVLLIRNLSLAWLGAALLLLILNILSVAMPATAGTVLYYSLVVVCSPMVCGHFWILSLFGWACLLMVSLKLLKK